MASIHYSLGAATPSSYSEVLSRLDALYFTVTTLATVGYGETHPLSTGGRIFTMGLIFTGGVMAAFALTDRQAESILNLRLRNLRRLEEMELKKERARLAKERKHLAALLESETLRRTELRKQLEATREQFAGAFKQMRESLGVMYHHRGEVYEALKRADDAAKDKARGVEYGYNPEQGVF